MVAAWIAIGMVIGIIISISAIELGRKRTKKVEATTRCTDKWSINNLPNPRVVAEYLLDANIPRNAKVVIKQCKDKRLLNGLDVRYNPNIKGSFAIGDDRAIILAGPFKENEIAFITVDRHIISKLKDMFDNYWRDGFKPKDV